MRGVTKRSNLKLEIMKFSVGQRVVAITDPKNSNCQPRKKGCVYVVRDVCYCPKTGRQRINIGELTNIDLYRCRACGGVHPTNGKGWTSSTHFKTLELDYEFVEEVIKQVREYEHEL